MSSIPRSTALIGLAGGFAAAAFPHVARAQTTTVNIAGVFSDLFAQPFYAKDAGAFAKAGFDVVTNSLNNAGAVAAAIGGGALELGTGDLVSGVNAINAGVPIVLIAGGGLYNEKTDSGSTILATASGSSIKTPKDLVGKTIGVPTLVGLTTACLRAWLPAHGVAETDVKLVEIPQSAALPALQKSTLDAGLLSEPFVTFGKGTVRAIGSPFDIAADLSPTKVFCVSVWYANKTWFQADSARAKKIVQAIYDTARWANSHRDDTFGILVRDGKLDADQARGMQRTTYATSLSVDMIAPVITIGTQNKMFAKAVDVSTLITKA
ncbi:MAG TPA: ABC transporter substrate-binding protein [Candidatus Lustribacter sp.]|jgi:NitT/TauT family transport system substrate-binding protein|nr:ABC transporter substrate-binding protein [Candidatus Lustribacter sp.]